MIKKGTVQTTLWGAGTALFTLLSCHPTMAMNKPDEATTLTRSHSNSSVSSSGRKIHRNPVQRSKTTSEPTTPSFIATSPSSKLTNKAPFKAASNPSTPTSSPHVSPVSTPRRESATSTPTSSPRRERKVSETQSASPSRQLPRSYSNDAEVTTRVITYATQPLARELSSMENAEIVNNTEIAGTPSVEFLRLGIYQILKDKKLDAFEKIQLDESVKKIPSQELLKKTLNDLPEVDKLNDANLIKGIEESDTLVSYGAILQLLLDLKLTADPLPLYQTASRIYQELNSRPSQKGTYDYEVAKYGVLTSSMGVSESIVIMEKDTVIPSLIKAKDYLEIANFRNEKSGKGTKNHNITIELYLKGLELYYEHKGKDKDLRNPLQECSDYNRYCIALAVFGNIKNRKDQKPLRNIFYDALSFLVNSSGSSKSIFINSCLSAINITGLNGTTCPQYISIVEAILTHPEIMNSPHPERFILFKTIGANAYKSHENEEKHKITQYYYEMAKMLEAQECPFTYQKGFLKPLYTNEELISGLSQDKIEDIITYALTQTHDKKNKNIIKDLSFYLAESEYYDSKIHMTVAQYFKNHEMPVTCYNFICLFPIVYSFPQKQWAMSFYNTTQENKLKFLNKTKADKLERDEKLLNDFKQSIISSKGFLTAEDEDTILSFSPRGKETPFLETQPDKIDHKNEIDPNGFSFLQDEEEDYMSKVRQFYGL